MSSAISPLAPESYVELPPIAGVRIETAAAGIKYKNRTDVMLMVFDEPVTVAGVFTTSKCPSAPVDFCRANLSDLYASRFLSRTQRPAGCVTSA